MQVPIDRGRAGISPSITNAAINANRVRVGMMVGWAGYRRWVGDINWVGMMVGYAGAPYRI